jgi:hypothetical protein
MHPVNRGWILAVILVTGNRKPAESQHPIEGPAAYSGSASGKIPSFVDI